MDDQCRFFDNLQLLHWLLALEHGQQLSQHLQYNSFKDWLPIYW